MLEKFDLAINNATKGLSYIDELQVLTRDIQSPSHQYWVREMVYLLFNRNQCQKCLKNFKGAQEDLRTCMNVIRSSSVRYEDNDAHPILLLSKHYIPSLSEIATYLQLIMAIQKVSYGVTRHFYHTEAKRHAVEQELSLSNRPK